MRSFKYKNNTIERNKVIKQTVTKLMNTDETSNYDDFILDNSKIESAKDNLAVVENENRTWFKNKLFNFDPYYDSEIEKHLNVFTNYLKKYTNQVPEYIDGSAINGKAFLDARDFLKNEIPYTPEMIMLSPESATGVFNDKLVYFDSGFTMDTYGNVYDVNKKCIFSPVDASQKISFVDLLNEKIIFESGVRISMPSDFIKEYFLDNTDISQDKKDRYFELKDLISQDKEGISAAPPIDAVAVVGSVPIVKADEPYIYLPLEDVYLGDVFQEEKIDMIKQIQEHKQAKDMEMCNFSTVPYNTLQQLLLMGGGERGEKPLCNEEMNSDDIIFLPDGTAAYTNSNATIKVGKSGCKKKKYKTGHVCMWTAQNQIGTKTSILQFAYKILNAVGIFHANIPRLRGFKKFKVFPGLCIGGLLEHAICSYQETVSEKINKLFRCTPMPLPSDSSQTGFENKLHPNGAIVPDCKALNLIKSAYVGDRYVVELVDPSITGLSAPAVGVFVLDPSGKLASTHPWKWNVWRGRPYNPSDNNSSKTITNDAILYENPLVIEAIKNTSLLGVDSITVALLALQNAYYRKNNLITSADIENNLEQSIKNIYAQVIDNLLYEIPTYTDLLTYQQGAMREYGNFESKAFIDRFLNYFDVLQTSELFSEVDLKTCERIYLEENVDEKNRKTTSTKFIYWDFSAYDPNKYLVPIRSKIPYYDLEKFCELVIPIDKIKNEFDTMLKQLSELGYDSSKYKKIHTIRDYINLSENSEELNTDISENLKYIRYDMQYDGYEDDIIDHVEDRCYHAINNKKIFNI